MVIRFGTSGWRAIVADEFTFANVSRVTKAVCRYLQASSAALDAALIVGYDTRFLAENFAEHCASEVAAAGYRAIFCDHATPTTTIAHTIRDRSAAGGISFTASHNPPEYNGMKLLTADGVPALSEAMRQIEQFISEIPEDGGQTVVSAGATNVEKYDPRPAYLADLARKVRFDVLARPGGSYAYDPLWGTGRGYLDRALRDNGLEVETLHDWSDALFGGRAPEPDEQCLEELRAAMKRRGCVLGLATSGNCEHFGVLDADGTFIAPNRLIPLLFDYLAESRGWTGDVARSVATSHLVDRVAAARGLPVLETPAGFNFIGELIGQDKSVPGGAEAAGLATRAHYPEQDGILACLLAAEAVAARGASLREQLEELYRRVGRTETAHIGVRLTPDVQARLTEKLKQDPAEIGGRRVARTNHTDGVKLVFDDGSWLLLRPSGTEPLVRIYAESESAQDLEVLLEQGRKYLLD